MVLLLSAALLSPLRLAAGPAPTTPFPADRAENQGLSRAALDRFASAVQQLVDKDRIVGAEVVIVRNRRLVFHRAFGMMDREAGIPMSVNGVYNLRSMTKPVTGVAAQLLIDEGRLSEEDFISKYIPSFGSGAAAKITVGHLLTHRSGLPMSVVTTTEDLVLLGSLSALADRAASTPLLFSPGASLNYSDTGTDVLARVVEVVSGRAVDQFVTQRILEPIGLRSMFYYTTGNERRGREICSAYTGTAGNWIKYWSSGDPSFYPFAMGSQTLYGTALDYARFLAFLLDGGKVEENPLLSAAALQRILTPRSPMPMNLGFAGVSGAYGQMMMLGMPEGAQGTKARPVCFGHGGSDGTIAWAWPDLDLIVCFFTQSRGHTADFLFDTAVQQCILRPSDDFGTPDWIRPLVGTYVDTYGPSGLGEIEILGSGNRLLVNISGQTQFPLNAPDAEGRFRFSPRPENWIAFDRDASGAVAGLTWHEGGKALHLPRTGTPAAEALVRRILATRASWRKHVGSYHTEEPGKNAEIVFRDGSLAVLPPGTGLVLYLNPPDASGLWRFRANPAVGITFQENEKGEVVSFTSHLPDGRVLHRPRVAGP